MLAHIVATQTSSETVTDASMGYPEDWQSPNPKPPKDGSEPLGHQIHGKTIAIHSLAVLPAHQRKGLGKTLMRAYIQRMEDAGVADRLSLLAHEHLVRYYEKLGFDNRGESKATFGGGGWYDMVNFHTLSTPPSPFREQLSRIVLQRPTADPIQGVRAPREAFRRRRRWRRLIELHRSQSFGVFLRL